MQLLEYGPGIETLKPFGMKPHDELRPGGRYRRKPDPVRTPQCA